MFQVVFAVSLLVFSLFLPVFSNTNNVKALEYSKAECVIEQSSKRILYANSADKQLPIASTTKILTAITVLDREKNLDREIEIPKSAEGVEGSSVYLKAGEKRSIKTLLYGLMLRSGNDCATALALEYGENIADFCRLMSVSAQKAGAFNSQFVNPHGLHDNRHYSTAKDLCYITAYAMKNNNFREIVKTYVYDETGWVNKNKLIREYPYCIGGKTGYTKKAGKCLVSVAQKPNDEEMTLICCVLDCPTTYARTKTLFDDAYERYKMVKILEKDTPIQTPYGIGRVTEDFSYPLLQEEIDLINFNFILAKKPFSTKNKGEIVAQIEISLANQLIFSQNLYKL